MGSFCCCKRETITSEPLVYEKKNYGSKPESIMLKSPKVTRKNTEDVLKFSELTIHPGDFVRRRSGINMLYENIGDVIGEGTYGRITKMKHIMTGKIKACKIIPKTNIIQGFTEEDIMAEIDILKSLEHINIIKLFEFFSDEKNYYLIQEYLERGDLFNNLEELNLDEFKISTIIQQILQAINYLNSKKIFHGDLKLENILIEGVKKMTNNHNEVSDYISIKLIDFGCSRMFLANEKYNEIIGTIYYCSPEVLRGEYDEKCDIWSAGVIMYVLLSGKMPFIGESFKVIKSKILDENFEIDFTIPELKDECSKQAIDLMKKLLIFDPKQRLSASEALSHPWFKDVKKSEKHLVSNKMTKNVLLHLRNYRQEMKFKLAVMTFITHNMGKNEEINKLKMVFKIIDKDNDGKISMEELKNALKEHLGTLAASEADLIFKEIGVSEQEGIEYEDFLRATMHKSKILNEENLKAAFENFDVEKEGWISAEGLKKILCGERQIADDVIKEFLQEINKNPDEKITFKDFTSLMYDKINNNVFNSIDSYRSNMNGDVMTSVELSGCQTINLLTK